ncbi:MAG TPA: hypothetical protein VJA87_00115 [Candidatus Paceibacterota bacterium]
MDERARKISETMRAKGLDNFKEWRNEQKRLGNIKSEYPSLEQGGDLAELIGVVLGDGHIEAFPRTERLLIFSNANNPGFVDRYANMVEKLFNKKPYVYKTKGKECIRIGIYEKQISSRLGVPTGARKELELPVPPWILSNKEYIVRYLRGLYEAEGSLSFHPPTYTHKFAFSNLNQSLLGNVHDLMSSLGFHPSKGSKVVQISRKAEVAEAVELIQFRKYSAQ